MGYYTHRGIHYVDGGNEFNEAAFNEAKQLLNEGKKVIINTSVIGHTRHCMIQYSYKQKLVEAYGDSLEVEYIELPCRYDYKFYLRCL